MSEEPVGTLDLPSGCIPPMLAGEELIARPVPGDSMTGDGILPGDVLLIARGRQPADGDIAVVHYTLPAGGRGKVVKHVRRSGDVLVLESSNPTYAPMVIEPDADPVIEGLVIGQLRKIRPAAPPPAAPDEDNGPATSGFPASQAGRQAQSPGATLHQPGPYPSATAQSRLSRAEGRRELAPCLARSTPGSSRSAASNTASTSTRTTKLTRASRTATPTRPKPSRNSTAATGAMSASQ